MGANAGYSAGRVLTGTNFTDTATGDPLSGSANSDPFSGAVYGVQAGYNWVRGRVVAGIEGDVQRSHQRASAASVCPGDTCNPALAPFDAPVTAAFEHKLPWFATLRGRIGAAVIPEVLAYITAGVAVGQVKATGSVTGFDAVGNGITDAFSYTMTKAGWTIGAGLEMQVFGNWSAKAEYLYMDFGSLGIAPSLSPDATVAVVINPRVTDHIVRVGVNYRFDNVGGVVAKF
jgi:iron complex outermembrane receptor protein